MASNFRKAFRIGFSEDHRSNQRRPDVLIVVFCANSERFTGYNLALRLVSLGCTSVHWYRGGFEAWKANNLPLSELAIHDW